MTVLNKQVRREASVTIREQGQNRPIVVILTPPGLIGLRAKGRRRVYTLPLETVYVMAVRAHVLRLAREKQAARRAAKQK